MSLKFELTNPEAIPDNLPVGEYTTKVVSTAIEDNEYIITLEYIGAIYDRNDPSCLFPLTKHDEEVEAPQGGSLE